MSNSLCIALAQQDFLMGDIEGNTKKIIATANQAREKFAADCIVFPELAITSYPPEDLLLRNELHKRVAAALKLIQQNITEIVVIVGHPEKINDDIYNAASAFYNGSRIARYYKQRLPNYSVFDEKRYFKRGDKPCIIDLKGIKTGIAICEDLWQPGVLGQAVDAGAEMVISLNASPFHFHKQNERLHQLKQLQQQEGQVPILYLNCVGGQDELIFDGRSVVIDGQGKVQFHAPAYRETVDVVRITSEPSLTIKPALKAKFLDDNASIYQAIVLGTKDYIEKNGFSGALIGLSGGIDSALVFAIACDAIGSDRVNAVLMPSRYTAKISIEDAIKEAENLGAKHRIISIEPSFESFLTSLKDEFDEDITGITTENIQARCRGVLLMALSNQTENLVLACGNKSELAVGYATMYGDMVGGYAPLKDIPKTTVYKLAHYRNSISAVIPERVLQREPSAELAANQIDQDVLPPYDILDPIMLQYVEHDKSIDDIASQGFDRETVEQVVKLIDRNEYKRRQGTPGVRISTRSFGRDWRYPITAKFRK